MKPFLRAAVLLPLFFCACDRLTSATSSQDARVRVVPRFAAGTTVPSVARLETRLSATGQVDSVVNVVYSKGTDLTLGSVPANAAFSVSVSGYDSASNARIVRWSGNGSGTAGSSGSQDVAIATDSGPSSPSGTASSTTVPATLSLVSGAYYTTDGSDPRVSSTATVSTGTVPVTTAGTVRAATKTTSGTTTLWSAVSSWTFTSVTPPSSYTLTVTPPTGGTIKLNQTGSTFASGTTVIATATASSGYTFSAWTGASTSTISVCTLTVTKDTTLGANFAAVPSTDTTLATLSVSTGTLAPVFSPKTTAYFDTVGATVDSETITATANASNATVSGAGSVDLSTLAQGTSITKTIKVTNGASSLAYTVTIVKRALPKYTLTVTPPTGGTIALNKTGSTFASGTTVIATATASSGYAFSAWTGASTSTTSVCTLTVTKDTTLGASFIVSGSTTVTTSADGMKLIPAGTFTMGSPTMEANRSTDETQHSVTLSAFYMDSTDVTQGQYLAVMGVNPSSFTSCGTTCPVENVTWFDAVLYCNARSKKAGLDTVYSYTARTGTYGNGVSALKGIAADLSKNGYRLPTEAQWEYAARGGTKTAYYWGDDTSTATVSKYAWYTGNASSITHPVATKLPNAYRLYDMAGNVWQWTNDWYGTYSTTAATDPSGPSSGSYRVLRSGGWGYDASALRSAHRGNFVPDYCDDYGGFRSVRPGS